MYIKFIFIYLGQSKLITFGHASISSTNFIIRYLSNQDLHNNDVISLLTHKINKTGKRE